MKKLEAPTKKYYLYDLKGALYTALKNDIYIGFEAIEPERVIIYSYHMEDVYSTYYTYNVIDNNMYFTSDSDGSYHHTKKQDNISERILYILSSIVWNKKDREAAIELLKQYALRCNIIYDVKYGLYEKHLKINVTCKYNGNYNESYEIDGGHFIG